MAEPPANDDETDLGPPTVPEHYPIQSRGFNSEERARNLGILVGACVREFSRVFDLGTLDGVTVAYDYTQALLDLDRGYATSFKLMPSEGRTAGIAMTPSVLRKGVLKSHILLDAGYMAALEDPASERFRLALHTIAHECTHVEITHKFNTAFPGVLLHQAFDVRSAYRSDITLACWDEYAATRLSAGYGEALTDWYEQTFLAHLADARESANESIKAFRLHGNVDRVLIDVHTAYGGLLKYAAYLLGDLDGRDASILNRAAVAQALAGHWFEPFFARLHSACRGIAADYGRWTDQATFEVIGDLAEELLGFGGVHMQYRTTGQVYIDIPFTAETMPGGPIPPG